MQIECGWIGWDRSERESGGASLKGRAAGEGVAWLTRIVVWVVVELDLVAGGHAHKLPLLILAHVFLGSEVVVALRSGIELGQVVEFICLLFVVEADFHRVDDGPVFPLDVGLVLLARSGDVADDVFFADVDVLRVDLAV